jgi:dihydroorotate dehydrogenase
VELPNLYTLFRRLLSLFPAEFSHTLALKGLKLLHQLGLAPLLASREISTEREIFGLHFANPVGLAAGLDKNGDYIDALGALGFGFIEVGTITPKPQSGNPKPRLFRLQEERGIINRMGFNNKGVVHLVKQLKKRRYKGIVGVNIGKNLSTPFENAQDDYLYCLREVYPYADYVVINLSSPNTPGLRKLQFGEDLDKLLASIKAEQCVLAEKYHRYVPLLLKIAPDISEKECEDIALAVIYHKFEGIIATNTTVDRQKIHNSKWANESGGLSGAPLREQASAVVRHLQKYLHGVVPIIAVGGVDSQSSAREKFEAGASLVQVYTGFIYKGPHLIGDIQLAAEQA